MSIPGKSHKNVRKDKQNNRVKRSHSLSPEKNYCPVSDNTNAAAEFQGIFTSYKFGLYAFHCCLNRNCQKKLINLQEKYRIIKCC